MVSTRRQAIIWTNDGYITDAYMHHSELDPIKCSSNITWLGSCDDLKTMKGSQRNSIENFTLYLNSALLKDFQICRMSTTVRPLI